ncbi:ATP-binding cassette domain-containing protein [Chryseobacterium sp. 1B4]
MYGIIGESGSGKSSIINLLCRLEKPSTGNIICNDRNIEYFDNWSQHIALIERENQLFNDTIENNISYGSPVPKSSLLEEIISDAELIHVISEKKDGLQTNISNYTTVISDGQKQRVSIARALLKKPSIIIFDEATSALDILLEKKIVETLKRKYSDSIIIIVTHRHNLLDELDAVYKVQDKTILNIRKNIVTNTELH